MIEKNVWTVNDLVSYIKHQLTTDAFLTNVTVCGEIGNFTNHYSGHWYFSIKDNNAFINCVMFRSANSRVGFIPEVSQQVVVRGNVTVFEKSGQLQLNVLTMQPVGVGKFYLQFEQTKKKLAPLGYFLPENKKAIPPYPMSIAVVTGANTAALQDVRITLKKRWPFAQLKEFYALVQGENAAKDMIRALKEADESNCNVMILARGGGSVDDLWCFNDEQLARTIFALKTPIVTGIGHEVDTTIAELVADERCATPTAAATRVSPDVKEVLAKLDNYKVLFNKYLTNRLQLEQQTLDLYVNSLNSFKFRLDKLTIYLENYKFNLKQNLLHYFNNASLAYIDNKHKLSDNLTELKQKISSQNNQVTLVKNNMQSKMKELFINQDNLLNNYKITLKQNLVNYQNNACLALINAKHNLNDNKALIKENISLKNKENELLITNIYSRMKVILNQNSSLLQQQLLLLENVNPLNILKRGFSLTYSEDKIVKYAKDTEVGQELVIKYQDGDVKAKITERNIEYGK